jgi:hypothetical protein
MERHSYVYVGFVILVWAVVHITAGNGNTSAYVCSVYTDCANCVDSVLCQWCVGKNGYQSCVERIDFNCSSCVRYAQQIEQCSGIQECVTFTDVFVVMRGCTIDGNCIYS